MATTKTAAPQIQALPCADCSPGPVNRKHIAEMAIKELAHSIQHEGQLQPIVVRPRPRCRLLEPDMVDKTWRILDASNKVLQSFDKAMENPARLYFATCNMEAPYEIIAGECRWRACNLLKQATIHAIVRTDVDDQAAIKARLAENLHRTDLSALDEAAQYRDALDHGYTVPALAKEIGRGRSHIFARLRLLTASQALQEALMAGTVPASIAELIATIPGEKAQAKALKEITSASEWDYEAGKSITVCMSAREAKTHIERRYRIDLKDAPFSLDLDCANSGPCSACPKRSGNLDPETPRPNVCTDPACYHAKADLHRKTLLLKASEQGHSVLPPSKSKELFWYGSDLKSGQGYVKASDPVPGDKRNRTFAQVLKSEGGDGGKTTAVALDLNDKPVKLIDLKAAAPLLEAAGVKLEARRSTSGAGGESAAQRAKRELDQRVSQELGKRLAEALADPKLAEKTETELWRLIVMEAIYCFSVPEELYTRHGWKMSESLTLKLPKLDRPTLRALWGELAEPEMNRDAQTKLTHALRIDRAALEKEIRAQLAEESKLPKDGAKIEVPQEQLDEWSELTDAEAVGKGKLSPSKPLEFRGRRWHVHGSVSSGARGCHSLDLHLLVPLKQYKGKTGTDEEINAGRDPGKTAATNIGVKLAIGAETYVCSKPEITLIPKAKDAKSKAGK